MLKCQVFGCPDQATVRCDNGFRYCSRHLTHEHTDGVKNFRASWRPIGPDGEYVARRRKQETSR